MISQGMVAAVRPATTQSMDYLYLSRPLLAKHRWKKLFLSIATTTTAMLLCYSLKGESTQVSNKLIHIIALLVAASSPTVHWATRQASHLLTQTGQWESANKWYSRHSSFSLFSATDYLQRQNKAHQQRNPVVEVYREDIELILSVKFSPECQRAS